jgi:4'-phosphopantetheinyl transferase
MTVLWSLSRADALPAGDDWLGPSERAVQANLKFPKRRAEWRLGRHAAKRLLTDLVGVQAFDRIQIIAAEDGAPEAVVDGFPLEVSLSISHRDGIAAAAITRHGRVGCDLEAIEPRTARFVEDYFTRSGCEAIVQSPPRLRDRHVALTWSAKESALKVLRTGLRRDTRSVEVEIHDPSARGDVWSPLEVTISPGTRRFAGRWRQLESWVLTVVNDDFSSGVARHDEKR